MHNQKKQAGGYLLAVDGTDSERMYQYDSKRVRNYFVCSSMSICCSYFKYSQEKFKWMFGNIKRSSIFATQSGNKPGSTLGEMAEWSNAAVLKTVVLQGTGGSNPSLSALKVLITNMLSIPFFYIHKLPINSNWVKNNVSIR